MEQSLARRPRHRVRQQRPSAEQVSATPVVPHYATRGPGHITFSSHACWPCSSWGTADCRPHRTSTRPSAPTLHRACLTSEASPTLATDAPLRRRGPRPGAPKGHNPHNPKDTHRHKQGTTTSPTTQTGRPWSAGHFCKTFCETLAWANFLNPGSFIFRLLEVKK